MLDRLNRWFVTYADPRRDGSREAVTGFGQLELAGPDGQGRKTYQEES
jgi:hypothetical protein